MQESIECRVALPGVSVFIGTSRWTGAQDWVCPQSTYVVCQRLSEGHSPLQLSMARTGLREVYPRVRALGFMPASGAITMQPLGHPLRTLNCWFDGAFFESATELDQRGWQDYAGQFLPLANRCVETMMRRIQLELEEPGFGAEQVIEAASTMVAVEMARMAQARSCGPVSAGLVPWQLRRVRERIAASLEIGYPKVRELAELCGVSNSHLMRMFKNSTGASLHGYITGERLLAARHLLSGQGMSIKEIAANLGFSSASHFTNAFQRHEGTTPREYRRRALASGEFGQAGAAGNCGRRGLAN